MEEVSALRVSLTLNTAEFSQRIKDINSRLRAIKSEFSAVDNGTKAWRNSLEGLQSKSDMLNRQLEVQRKKVESLKDEYEKVVVAQGEDSRAAAKLAAEYNNAVGVMRRMESSLQNTNRRINEQSSEFGQLQRRVTGSVDSLERELRVLESSMNTVATSMSHVHGSARQMGQGLDELRTRENQLNSSIDIQRRRLQELNTLLEATTREEGQNSRATQEMQIRYNQASQALNRTQSELHQTQTAIQTQSSAWGRLGQALSGGMSQMSMLGMNLQMTGMGIAMTFGMVARTVGGAMGLAVKKSMDFEAQMSSVKSVMAPDEVNQFGAALEKLAQKMGSQTKYSATEAAQGIEELVKAGVSVKDILNGGLSGALSLATAGELELKDAAEVASTALNAFRTDNITVAQAADILAGAANTSATDVGEMKFGLSMVSAVASGVGLTFKDTATALAAFAQNGLKGSDAGTSLKTMLLRLSPTTKAASDQMDALGLGTKNTTAAYNWLMDRGIKPASQSTKDVADALQKLAKIQAGTGASASKIGKEYNKLAAYSGYASSAFYDTNGNLKSMSEIAGILQKALKGLNSEQRQQALRTMFGTDAIRAANILYKEGTNGINEMAKSMGKVSAADVAKAKLDNFKGTITHLKSSLTTAGIAIGEKLTPSLGKLASIAQKITDAFNNLSPGMQKFIAIGGALTAIILTIVTALGMILMVVGAVVSAWAILSEAMAPIGAVMMSSILPVIGVIVGIAAVAALLYAAWKTNFGGIRDFTSQVWTLIVQKFNEVKGYIMPLITQLVGYIKEQWKTIGPMVSIVMNAIGAVIKFILPFIFDTIKFYLNAIINVFKGAFNIIAGVIKFFVALFSGDWSGMWAAIKQVLLGVVQAIWGIFNLWFVGKIAGIFGKFINKGLGFIGSFVGKGIGFFTSFVSKTFSSISGWISTLISSITSGMSGFIGVIAKGLAKGVKSYIDFALSIYKTLFSIVGKMTSIGVNIAKGIWSGIKSMGSWLAGQLKNWALAVIPGPIAKALGIKSPSRLMRDQIGKWIPAGVAEGITGNLGVIKSSISQMSLAAIPTSIPTTTIPIAQMNQSKNESAAINQPQPQVGPIIIQSVLNGRIIAEETYSDINKLLNQQSIRQNRMGGVL
jgi:TP901 family phage tail tape measure protein